MSTGWAIVGGALACWVWSRFFAAFPSAPPVNAKMTDPEWHARADAAQAQRTQTLGTLWVIVLVVLLASIYAIVSGN